MQVFFFNYNKCCFVPVHVNVAHVAMFSNNFQGTYFKIIRPDLLYNFLTVFLTVLHAPEITVNYQDFPCISKFRRPYQHSNILFKFIKFSFQTLNTKIYNPLYFLLKNNSFYSNKIIYRMTIDGCIVEYRVVLLSWYFIYYSNEQIVTLTLTFY